MDYKRLIKALKCDGYGVGQDNDGCANKRCGYRDSDGACNIVSMCDVPNGKIWLKHIIDQWRAKKGGISVERLTQKRFDGNYEWCCAKCAENCRREIACENCEELGGVVDRLGAIEEILGDNYDLSRLRELVTADKEGRCVIFRRDYPVMSEYAPADEDGLYTRTVTGVITQAEYEAALAEKGAGNAQGL